MSHEVCLGHSNQPRPIEVSEEMRPKLNASGHQEGGNKMSENQSESEPEEISRFRVVVVAALRVKQLRRGSMPRIEMDDKKHKDTIIAMEEVRRGLITFTQLTVPQAEIHNETYVA